VLRRADHAPAAWSWLRQSFPPNPSGGALLLSPWLCGGGNWHARASTPAAPCRREPSIARWRGWRALRREAVRPTWTDSLRRQAFILRSESPTTYHTTKRQPLRVWSTVTRPQRPWPPGLAKQKLGEHRSTSLRSALTTRSSPSLPSTVTHGAAHGDARDLASPRTAVGPRVASAPIRTAATEALLHAKPRLAT